MILTFFLKKKQQKYEQDLQDLQDLQDNVSLAGTSSFPPEALPCSIIAGTKKSRCALAEERKKHNLPGDDEQDKKALILEQTTLELNHNIVLPAVKAAHEATVRAT